MAEFDYDKLVAIAQAKADECRASIDGVEASEEGDWHRGMPPEVVASLRKDAEDFGEIARALAATEGKG